MCVDSLLVFRARCAKVFPRSFSRIFLCSFSRFDQIARSCTTKHAAASTCSQEVKPLMAYAGYLQSWTTQRSKRKTSKNILRCGVTLEFKFRRVPLYLQYDRPLDASVCVFGEVRVTDSVRRNWLTRHSDDTLVDRHMMPQSTTHDALYAAHSAQSRRLGAPIRWANVRIGLDVDQ